jgi:hypothetical protein
MGFQTQTGLSELQDEYNNVNQGNFGALDRGTHISGHARGIESSDIFIKKYLNFDITLTATDPGSALKEVDEKVK